MDNLWKEFEKSGTIDAYLRYRSNTQNIADSSKKDRNNNGI